MDDHYCLVIRNLQHNNYSFIFTVNFDIRLFNLFLKKINSHSYKNLHSLFLPALKKIFIKKKGFEDFIVINKLKSIALCEIDIEIISKANHLALN